MNAAVPPIATVGASNESAANDSFAMGRADSDKPAATDKLEIELDLEPLDGTQTATEPPKGG